MQKTERTKIKICGLTRACDIDFVNEALPDYIGFVFAKSRRRVEEEQAKLLKSRLREGITAVGVFVDAPEEQIIRLTDAGIIDAVQLHGKEAPETVARIKEKIRCPVIKALRPEERQLSQTFMEAYERAGADCFLFDGGAAGPRDSAAVYGGAGQAFDWTLLHRPHIPFFLAGGLNITNIEKAVRTVRPYAVDISSGVETGGKKEREKILEIVDAVRRV